MWALVQHAASCSHSEQWCANHSKHLTDLANDVHESCSASVLSLEPCAERAASMRPSEAIEVGRGRVVPVDLQQSLGDLFIVSLIAALAPIAARLLSRLRVPQVVILILGGIMVGPQLLGVGGA